MKDHLKDQTVNEYSGNIMGHKPCVSCGDMSGGKNGRCHNGAEPKREYFRAFPKEETPICDFLAKCRNDDLNYQQCCFIKGQNRTRPPEG